MVCKILVFICGLLGPQKAEGLSDGEDADVALAPNAVP